MSLPLWCLFLAALLLVGTKAPVAVAMARQGKGYDNRHPRAQQKALTGWGARAMAAHANHFEAFPVFAAGVLVAEATGSSGALPDTLAVLFIVARIGYTLLYIMDVHMLRSLVWTVGFLSSLALLLSPVLL